MDVDTFIQKYRPDWVRLEESVAKGSRGLSRMNATEIGDVIRLYLRTSGHLAEAQTKFRDAALESYLNRTVQAAHAAIYGGKAASLRDAVRFFGRTYRQALRRTAPFIFAMGFLLIVTMAGSALFVVASPDVAAEVIPPETQAAVEDIGSQQMDPSLSPTFSTFILTNNVRVALLAFALGIAFGVGTIAIVLFNGQYLGLHAGAFHSAGLAGQWWAIVMPHGFLELTAIAIAAGAGFRMGWALVAPGDRTRGKALAEDARDSVLVVIGVVPAFVVAAIYEGFLRGELLPSWISITIGAATALAYVFFLALRPKRDRMGVITARTL